MTDNSAGTPQDDSKLVIDEDWKSKVQSEKEAAEAVPPAGASPGTATSPGAGADANSGPAPPASFAQLTSMLALQAAAALGQLPDPGEGHPVVRPDIARHFIDLLGVLETKTQGNLTDEEKQMLTGVLSELRLAFVAVQSNPPKTTD